MSLAALDASKVSVHRDAQHIARSLGSFSSLPLHPPFPTPLDLTLLRLALQHALSHDPDSPLAVSPSILQTLFAVCHRNPLHHYPSPWEAPFGQDNPWD